VEDDAAIETTRFEFVPIESLNNVQPNEFVDILGVCVGVGPLTNLTSKAGQELRKRSLTLLDKTLCQVEVTLWGDQADKWNEETLGNNAIVAVKSCKVSDFGGRSLSSSFQSQIFVNPDHPESHALRAWYDANGAALTDLQVSEREQHKYAR
jgi:replication factor A1